MFCTNCGQKIEDGMKFCPNCGQPVAPETAATANASALSIEAAATVNASALGAEAAATVNASGLGTDDAAVETVESTTAASAATEDTSAAADAEASAENAPAGRMDEASATPAAGLASEMPPETPDGNASADTLGNTTEQYKRRLEEGRAASGTEGNTSGAAHSTQAGASADTQSGSSTAQSDSSAYQTRSNSGTAQQTPPPVNHGPAVNGIPSEPDGDGTIRTVGLILLILTVLFAVPQIWTTIASFFRIIQNLFSFSFHSFVELMYSFLNFILNVVKLAGYGFIGGGMYLVWKKWSDRDAEPLLMTVIAGGVMLVLEALLRGILSALFQRYYAIGSASWGIGFAILAIVLLVVLITQKQLNPFAGLAGNFADGLRRDLDRVTDLAQEKNSAARATASDAKAYGATDDSIGAQTGTADHSAAGVSHGNGGPETADADGNFNRYYQAKSQQGGVYTGPLKTDRSLVLYILLGFLTCGIYQLYVFYTIMRDVNVACDGDGRHTPGLLEFILFGILTCGIYDLYWFYSVGNRLADNAPRYGLHFQENGTTLLLWMIIGSLLCFIGSYVGIYFLLNNVNAICSAYNQQR